MNYKVLNKNDKIVVYINKDVDVNRTYELTKYIQNQFPDNQVIVIHNLFIDNRGVVANAPTRLGGGVWGADLVS